MEDGGKKVSAALAAKEARLAELKRRNEEVAARKAGGGGGAATAVVPPVAPVVLPPLVAASTISPLAGAAAATAATSAAAAAATTSAAASTMGSYVDSLLAVPRVPRDLLRTQGGVVDVSLHVRDVVTYEVGLQAAPPQGPPSPSASPRSSSSGGGGGGAAGAGVFDNEAAAAAVARAAAVMESELAPAPPAMVAAAYHRRRRSSGGSSSMLGLGTGRGDEAAAASPALAAAASIGGAPLTGSAAAAAAPLHWRSALVPSRLRGNLAVSDLDWAPTDAAYLAVAYVPPSTDTATGSSSGSGSGGDVLTANGGVAVWDVAAATRTATFTAAARVTAVRMSPFDSSLVLGGTSVGSVVVWDVRAKGDKPVAQSAWSEAAHIFPIVSLLFSDLLAPNALLSLSTDGRLCQFAAGRGEGASGGPRDPTRSLQLRAGRAVLPSAAAFSRVDASRLYVGCEEGALAVVDVNGDKESAPGSRVAAHYAYVSALDVHPSLDAPLLLTASFDGTVKLWATETATPTLLEVLDALAGTAVVDAAWSPTNESALVAADADGRLALYQLGRDAVDPTLLLPSPGDAPFTRLRWAPHGRALAVGDAAGGVYLAAVHADLVDTPPGGDAAALLAHYVDARGSRF